MVVEASTSAMTISERSAMSTYTTAQWQSMFHMESEPTDTDIQEILQFVEAFPCINSIKARTGCDANAWSQTEFSLQGDRSLVCLAQLLNRFRWFCCQNLTPWRGISCDSAPLRFHRFFGGCGHARHTRQGANSQVLHSGSSTDESFH